MRTAADENKRRIRTTLYSALFVTTEQRAVTQIGLVPGGFSDRPTTFAYLADHTMRRNPRNRALP